MSSNPGAAYASLLATAGDDGLVKGWNLLETTGATSSKPTFELSSHHAQPVLAVRWNHTCQVVASAGHDGYVALHHDKKLLHKLPQTSHGSSRRLPRLNAISFSSGCRFLCSGGLSRSVELWDLKKRSAAPVKVFKDHVAEITCVEVSPRDQFVASSSVGGHVLVHGFAANAGRLVAKLVAPRNASTAIKSIAFSPFEHRLLSTAGDDGVVRIWDVGRHHVMHEFGTHRAPATCVSWAPVHQSLLVSSALDKTVVFYDVNTKKLVKSIKTSAPLTCVDMDASGTTLAVGTMNGQVFVYDLKKSKEPRLVLSHSTRPSPVNAVQFAKYRRASRTSTSSSSSSAAADASLSFTRNRGTPLSILPDDNNDALLSPIHGGVASSAHKPGRDSMSMSFHSPIPDDVDEETKRQQLNEDEDEEDEEDEEDDEEEDELVLVDASPRMRTPQPSARQQLLLESSQKKKTSPGEEQRHGHQHHHRRRNSGSKQKKSKKKGPEPTAALSAVQAEVFRSMIDEAMTAFRDEVRHDITNLHLELLRQFHIQQTEIRQMLNGFASDYKSLLEEVKTLRDDQKMLDHHHHHSHNHHHRTQHNNK